MTTSLSEILFFIQTEEDYEFEEKLLSNPYSLKTWLDYITYKQSYQASFPNFKNIINMIYERAINFLPGSYKLWNMYLDLRIMQCENLHPITSLDPKVPYVPYPSQSIESSTNMYQSLFEQDDEVLTSISSTLGTLPIPKVESTSTIVDKDMVEKNDDLRIIEAVNFVFERALLTMHRMPKLWLKYLRFLVRFQPCITKVRLVLNRALQALPITQHSMIWKFIISDFIFNEHSRVPSITGTRLLKRYLRIEPTFLEEYLNYLLKVSNYTEACEVLIFILNYTSETSQSLNKGTRINNDYATKHHEIIAMEKATAYYLSQHSTIEVWNLFCSILSEHAAEVKLPHSRIETTLLSGIKRYPSEVGNLWTTIAQYYIQYGKFDLAMNYYEKGMEAVSTVKDWNLIFDTYAKLYDELIKVKMSKLEEKQHNKSEELELEILIAKYENLMDRRPLLLNSVKLRQNPNNIHEWHQRIKLIKEEIVSQESQKELQYSERQKTSIIEAYEAAISTIKPNEATNGRLYSIWNSYARFYEIELKSIEKARVVYKRCLTNEFGTKNYITSYIDLEKVVCDYAEMEIRNHNYQEAISVLYSMTHPSSEEIFDEEYKPLDCTKNTTVWGFLLDLEESINKDIKKIKKLYSEMLELKIITPNIVINFAQLLIENRYFEEAFKVFERAISLFHYPQVYPIWIQYLLQFVNRYQHTKAERTRDLFEQAIKQLPFYSKDEASLQFSTSTKHTVKNIHARDFYLLYANFEENYGMTSKAINIYNRAIQSVTSNSLEQFQLYQIYLTRVYEMFGISKTREVLDNALNTSSENNDGSENSMKFIRDLSLRYIYIELKLGEVDRCRSIFGFASSFCNPEMKDNLDKFWNRWDKFEKQFGNIETFKEMLRVKRFVKQQFNVSTNTNLLTAQVNSAKRDRHEFEANTDAMKELEKSTTK
ncbi:hypothetical protein ABK040_009534 [Willaertia magna]